MNITEKQILLIKQNIQSIPNYPKPGIVFQDITNILAKPFVYETTINLLANHYRNKNLTKIIGIEARGFFFAAPLALALNLGFIPVRKAGKLPRNTIQEYYTLEYGIDSLEIHIDAIIPGDKVLLVDDVIATGGTMVAAVKLIRRLGGKIQDVAAIINLFDLGGEASLKKINILTYSLVIFSNCN